jgi:hypothetical protein
MSCANKTVGTSIRLTQYSSSRATPRSRGRKTDTATEGKTFLDKVESKLAADESRSKKYHHEIKPGSIRDCARTDPEYVWGDEGPINE